MQSDENQRLKKSRGSFGDVCLRLRKSVTVFVVAMLAAGCIVVPVGMFNESPYSPEILSKLATQGANRNLVRQLLGKPEMARDGDRYWFYSHSRPTFGIIGGSSSAVFTEDEWLLVEFDNSGHVTFVEKADKSKCLSNGICLDGSGPHAIDVQAKSHVASTDECTLYLFLEKLPWPLLTGVVKFSVDGKPIGVVNSKTYLFQTHRVGDIEIAAYDLKISARCIGGEKLFVHAIKKKDMSWETGEDLAPITNAEGETALRSRQLALPD